MRAAREIYQTAVSNFPSHPPRSSDQMVLQRGMPEHGTRETHVGGFFSSEVFSSAIGSVHRLWGWNDRSPKRGYSDSCQNPTRGIRVVPEKRVAGRKTAPTLFGWSPCSSIFHRQIRCFYWFRDCRW